MSEAPERIWAVPEYNCTVYMSGNSPITAQTGPFEHRLHGQAAAYVRADLSDALLREAMEVLDWYAENSRLARLIHSEGDKGRNAIAQDGGKQARATLAKLREHLEDKA